MKDMNELEAFEAWFKEKSPVGGVNAKLAARAAWQARAAIEDNRAQRVPVVSVRDAVTKSGPLWEKFCAVYETYCGRQITIREIAWRCFLAASTPAHPAPQPVERKPMTEQEGLRSEDRSHALDLAAEIERLTQQLQAYEKHGVTCQTFRHFVSDPCAECNSPGRCATQVERGLEEARRKALEDRYEFNRAINFAIDQGVEGCHFLAAWREGDPSGWPEFDAARKEQT